MLFQKTRISSCKCFVINGEAVVALTLSCAVELYAAERGVEITDELMATIRNPSKIEADAAFIAAEAGMLEYHKKQLKDRQAELEKLQQEQRKLEEKLADEKNRQAKANKFHSMLSIGKDLKDHGYFSVHRSTEKAIGELSDYSKQLSVQVSILAAIDKLTEKIDKLPSRIATAMASATAKQEKELLKRRENVANAEFKAASAKIAAINARPALLVTMSNEELDGEFEQERVVESW